MPRWQSFEPYFWSLVKKTKYCWIWQGGLDSKGYGRVWHDNRRQRAHRVAFKLTYGKIPADMLICHHCDNKKCVRPKHLFAGTHSDNMLDCTKKGRNTLIECPWLMKRGNDHWTRLNTKRSKLLLKRISALRRKEWKDGRRRAIRNSRGQIMGTRMVSC